MQIQNQVFLVTGGGSGLGAATARMLVRTGGKVVVADVSASGDDVARELGANARFAKTDVTDEASTQAAIDLCVSAFGAIHGAVNCAGIAPGERVVGKNGRGPARLPDSSHRHLPDHRISDVRLTRARCTRKSCARPTGARMTSWRCLRTSCATRSRQSVRRRIC